MKNPDVLLNLAAVAGIKLRLDPLPYGEFLYTPGHGLYTMYWEYDWDTIHRLEERYPWRISVDHMKFRTVMKVLFDHDVLHEVCHAMVAWKWQLDHPEYGLTQGLLSMYGARPVKQGDLLYMDWQALIEGVVSSVYQEAQELAVWSLVSVLGVMFKLNPTLSFGLDISDTWYEYYSFKMEELSEEDSKGVLEMVPYFYGIARRRLKKAGIVVPAYEQVSEWMWRNA